jgi:hypothetical protein
MERAMRFVSLKKISNKVADSKEAHTELGKYGELGASLHC